MTNYVPSSPVLFFLGPLRLNSTSDDNLLKNIELFDRLSMRYNGRILFIKDVIGDEICCWSFYGQSRKLAEVCCTSILYATEKKQTKVPLEPSPGEHLLQCVTLGVGGGGVGGVGGGGSPQNKQIARDVVNAQRCVL